MALKNSVLLGRAQAGKQRQHLGMAIQHLVRQVSAQMISRFTDFTLTRQKHQDVSSAVRAEPQLVHRIGNRIVQVVVARLFKRPIALLNWEHPARHHDDRCRPLGAGKVICKPLCINRCRRDDDLQVWPARQQLAQVAQQEINVQAAFVRLVNDDRIVGVQQWVGLRFSQQDTVSHQLDGGIAAQAILKTHLEADHLTKWGFQLFCNPLGHAAGSNAARLGVSNQFGTLARCIVQLSAPHAERDFRQLCGFSRAGFTADDDHLVGGNGSCDFISLA